MTPEERAVIDAAMGWRDAVLANPHGGTDLPAPVIDALTLLGAATYALAIACPTCDAGGHTCPGCGAHVGHTQIDCGAYEDVHREIQSAPADATTFPCWECLTDPTEDPLPWCDCRPNERASEMHLSYGGPCRFRAHGPEGCPNRPTSMEVTSRGAEPTPVPDAPTSLAAVVSRNSFKATRVRDDDPVWTSATLLYCLAGDRIRIGADETDVLRSSSGAWHANVVSSVMPSGKTWDKVTPWEHIELKLDLSANPGFQQYKPNTPCEILCSPERLAVLTLMTVFPGTKELAHPA